ncbi:ABC transporter ATP-binding protein [Haloarchaeobius iranensis]|uniref:ABC-2 type transport system ATP-binding protein n=1 Tax=Haloarchaeobius iranensis TaxID=996166 RepID=A0A1G9YF41_9EURY|nr:ABC transporter ATP-binding protein [Haloarchaeobius iranensis]SDN07680.1 ABC-2 type transport system ATP-binding protein [Haloarchaeobius iranensis]
MSAITVNGLTKEYGDVLANDAVSFEVEVGETFGYLGPNGAGKTTTIRTIMGFQSPTSGTATVLGADVRDEAALVEAKERVGYLPSNPGFDETATGTEILDLHASVKGDSRRAELLDLFDVPVGRKIRGYSTGQKQKLGLVQAFMHDPDLVVMDEPTAGLDPLVQQRFNEFIREETRQGVTVFLSSHVLSEVRRVCDRVGIIRDGRIVTVERVGALLDRSGKFVRLRVANHVDAGEVSLDGAHDVSVKPVDAVAAGAAAGGSGAVASTATELTFTFTGDLNTLVDFVDDFDVLELDIEEAPLEEIFMRFYDDEGVAV